MTGEYTDAVNRGMAWLDEHAPGWERQIDLDRLDLNYCPNCVIGQLIPPGRDPIAGTMAFDHESVALPSTYPTDHRFPVRLGFSLRSGSQEDYDNLTAEWRAAIGARLAVTP